jgi:flavin reductase (DIM6/NTAB) family NADH-FMN oxidoreductase RutF
MKHFNAESIMEADSFYRRNLINCLSGYKSLNLIGTKNSEGITNLAPFSQVIHIGANPPLVGILFRPHSVKRDTLENILATGFFSLNHVTPDFYKEAHWASANWDRSEFEATGLAEDYKSDFFAPFVKNSPVQIGCKLVETQTLKVNQTVFLIGSIEHLFVAEEGLRIDGSLDLEVLDSVSVAGLDDYFTGKRLGRLSYAKADHFPAEI